MTPTRFVKAFVVSFVLFTISDAVWHGGLMMSFYGQRLALMNPNVVGGPSISPFIFLVQAINAVTFSYILLHCRPSGQPVCDAVWLGALLGFTVTGTVNFLNHALLPWWDIVLALVDVSWGTVNGAIAGAVVVFLCPPPERKGLWGLLGRRA